MNMELIFDLLQCDVDVVFGVENCDNDLNQYLMILNQFTKHSGFQYLNTMIQKEEVSRASHTARMLAACSKRLGANYCFDLLHDMIGFIQSKNWIQANFIMFELLKELDGISATLRIHNSKVAIS